MKVGEPCHQFHDVSRRKILTEGLPSHRGRQECLEHPAVEVLINAEEVIMFELRHDAFSGAVGKPKVFVRLEDALPLSKRNFAFQELCKLTNNRESIGLGSFSS